MQTKHQFGQATVLFWQANAKWLVRVSLVIFILTLLIASARLVIFAVSTQPDCVAQSPDKAGTYLAAKTSC